MPQLIQDLQDLTIVEDTDRMGMFELDLEEAHDDIISVLTVAFSSRGTVSLNHSRLA